LKPQAEHTAGDVALHVRNGQALLDELHHAQLEAVQVAEALHLGPCGRGGHRDAQVHVQAGDVVAQARELKHQAQAVLAAGKGHQHALAGHDEPVSAYGLLHLAGEVGCEAVAAEGGIVARQGDFRWSLAFAAFHGGYPVLVTLRMHGVAVWSWRSGVVLLPR
jgi:hypothetical protein